MQVLEAWGGEGRKEERIREGEGGRKGKRGKKGEKKEGKLVEIWRFLQSTKIDILLSPAAIKIPISHYCSLFFCGYIALLCSRELGFIKCLPGLSIDVFTNAQEDKEGRESKLSGIGPKETSFWIYFHIGQESLRTWLNVNTPFSCMFSLA